jgi:hypothetical protein
MKTVLTFLLVILAAATGAFAQQAPTAPIFLGTAACPAASQVSDAALQPLWTAAKPPPPWPTCQQQCYAEYSSCTPNFCCGNAPGCPTQIDCYSQYQDCLSCCQTIGMPCSIC